MAHELEKINKEIESLARALSQTPDDRPVMPLLLACLGMAHDRRFHLLNEREDLDKAIEYKTIALTLTPDNNPELSELLASLAAAHGTRFRRLGDLYDIEKAIEYGRISVNVTSDGDSNMPALLSNLGAFHRFRFERLGEPVDLENAIQHKSRALAILPDDHPDLPRILNGLGASHIDRSRHSGELNGLENAIEYQSRALALISNSDPELPSILNNLGSAHIARFQRLGELSDLNNAIGYKSRAVAKTPDGHPDLPTTITGLGNVHVIRFTRLGNLSDLDNAIEYEFRALALTPDGSLELPFILSNLGLSHHVRFGRLGELNDLENAIEYTSRAVALTPDGHQELSRRLTALARSHANRFGRLEESIDLEVATIYLSRALASTPDDHPDTSGLHFNCAIIHFLSYQSTKDISHLQRALDFCRSASQSSSSAPRERFEIAQKWAQTASLCSRDSCIEAYQTTIDLLPQYIWLGSTTNQRYEDLSMTETLATDAASAAIRSSNNSLALEWLEHARCVAWNQSLMLRSPLDTLQSVDPDQGIRLRTVAEQLRMHSAGSDSRESWVLALSSATAEQVAQEHRRLAKEYDDLLVQIRKLPGFEDFLRPMKAKGLVQAARTGPVVVINCHTDRCDALVVLPGEDRVDHIPLPNFSARKAQQARRSIETSLRCKGVRSRGFKARQQPEHKYDMASVLAILWHSIVNPILDYLGCMNHYSSDTLPHITWCPTGALSFLPLHAAGDYSQPESRVFDYVISSYTPTLTALLAATPNSLSRDCRVLAVGQATTPGYSALPGTARELAYVQAHTENNIHYSQLMDSQATVPAVLDAMEQHDWVHLACHAHQNVKDPTQSGFFLHGGTLDLAAINRRSFKSKGLAFLSACQTAKGDERLANEAVHLASGMLMAGYTSVIGTMWSVHDDDAPLVADKVYDRLMKGGKIGSGEAGRALHSAVAALRETVGEQAFERWVPYIHIGS